MYQIDGPPFFPALFRGYLSRSVGLCFRDGVGDIACHSAHIYHLDAIGRHVKALHVKVFFVGQLNGSLAFISDAYFF